MTLPARGFGPTTIETADSTTSSKKNSSVKADSGANFGENGSVAILAGDRFPFLTVRGRADHLSVGSSEIFPRYIEHDEKASRRERSSER